MIVELPSFFFSSAHHVSFLVGSALQPKILGMGAPFSYFTSKFCSFYLSLCPPGQLDFFTRHSSFHVLLVKALRVVGRQQQVPTSPIYRRERLLLFMHVNQ